jgi:hypothetical protein
MHERSPSSWILTPGSLRLITVPLITDYFKKVEAGWTLAQPASFCGVSRILSRRSLLEENRPDDHLSHLNI